MQHRLIAPPPDLYVIVACVHRMVMMILTMKVMIMMLVQMMTIMKVLVFALSQ